MPLHLLTQQHYLAYCHLTYTLVVNDAHTILLTDLYSSHTRCQPSSQLISSTKPTANNLPTVVTLTAHLSATHNPQLSELYPLELPDA